MISRRRFLAVLAALPVVGKALSAAPPAVAAVEPAFVFTDTNYFYRVSAVDAFGRASPLSEPIQVDIRDRFCKLSWTPSKDPDVVRYHVQRVNPDGSQETLATLATLWIQPDEADHPPMEIVWHDFGGWVEPAV